MHYLLRLVYNLIRDPWLSTSPGSNTNLKRDEEEEGRKTPILSVLSN